MLNTKLYLQSCCLVSFCKIAFPKIFFKCPETYPRWFPSLVKLQDVDCKFSKRGLHKMCFPGWVLWKFWKQLFRRTAVNICFSITFNSQIKITLLTLFLIKRLVYTLDLHYEYDGFFLTFLRCFGFNSTGSIKSQFSKTDKEKG